MIHREATIILSFDETLCFMKLFSSIDYEKIHVKPTPKCERCHVVNFELIGWQ